MNFNFNKVKEMETIGSISREFEYVVVDQLPSNYRRYPHLGTIYIRGLHYVETVNLSKIGDKAELEQIISIYRDALKFKVDGFKIEDLEFADFLLLMTIINIQTVGPEYGWSSGVICKETIKNKALITMRDDLNYYSKEEMELEKRINEKSDMSTEEKVKMSKTLKELHSNNILLKEKIEEEVIKRGEFINCNTKLNSNIILSDLEFETSDSNNVPAKIYLGGVPVTLAPITIKDYIIYLKNKDEFAENGTPKILYSKSFFIVDDIPSEEKIDTLKYMTPDESKEFNDIIDTYNIKLNVVEKKCQNCNKVYKIKIGLTNLKVYP